MNLQDLGAADRMALFRWHFEAARERLGHLVVVAERLGLREEKQRTQAFILDIGSRCAVSMPSPRLARLIKEQEKTCRSEPPHYVCDHCAAMNELLKITEEL